MNIYLLVSSWKGGLMDGTVPVTWALRPSASISEKLSWRARMMAGSNSQSSALSSSSNWIVAFKTTVGGLGGLTVLRGQCSPRPVQYRRMSCFGYYITKYNAVHHNAVFYSYLVCIKGVRCTIRLGVMINQGILYVTHPLGWNLCIGIR